VGAQDVVPGVEAAGSLPDLQIDIERYAVCRYRVRGNYQAFRVDPSVLPGLPAPRGCSHAQHIDHVQLPLGLEVVRGYPAARAHAATRHAVPVVRVAWCLAVIVPGAFLAEARVELEGSADAGDIMVLDSRCHDERVHRQARNAEELVG